MTHHPGDRRPSARPVRVDRPADLDAAAVLAVADGAPVELSAGLLERVAASRRATLAALDRAGPVYGVTTGMGRQSDVAVAPAERDAYQDDLMLARAVGTAPWLDRRTVRAVLATRLRTLLEPEAGVSPGLLGALTGVLAADLHPAVPAAGNGAAGEIIPLAHLGGFLTGAGDGLDGPDGTDGTGAPAPAGRLLAAAGLEPYRFGAKEGVAFLQGVPVAAARAVLLGAGVRTLVAQALVTTAGEVAGVRAPRDPYHPALARGDDELGRVLACLRRLVGEEPAPRMLQAPVSFRVAGPALAHLMRAADRLDEAVGRVLEGVSTSPALVDGAFLGTAGFDGFDLAAAADAVHVALLHCAELGTARLHRMLDPKVTGLPPQLSPEPGRQAGLVVLHKRAVGLVHEARRRSSPASLGAAETSLGQEDVQSFALEALGSAIGAADVLRDVVACELVALHQASLLEQDASSGEQSTKQASRLEMVLRKAFEVLPTLTNDRPPGREVAAVRGVLSVGWAHDVLDRAHDAPSRPARPPA